MLRGKHHESVSLRISVTERCQLNCLYCSPAGQVDREQSDESLSDDEILDFVRIVKTNFGLSKVHLTGGEPLRRPDILDLIARLGPEDIGDLVLTTNGQQLARLAEKLKNAGLHRVNISLDSLNPDTFARLTGGGILHYTLEAIRTAKESGLYPVKLNVTVLRNVNSDEVVDIARIGLWLGCQVRFLELMPIGPAAQHFGEWFINSDEVRTRLSTAFEFQPLAKLPNSSSTSRNYLAKDNKGREGIIGFISSRSDPFCSECRRLRLTSRGQLIGCLARGEGPDIRRFLRNKNAPDEPGMINAINTALSLKRKVADFTIRKTMDKIGG